MRRTLIPSLLVGLSLVACTKSAHMEDDAFEAELQEQTEQEQEQEQGRSEEVAQTGRDLNGDDERTVSEDPAPPTDTTTAIDYEGVVVGGELQRAAELEPVETKPEADPVMTANLESLGYLEDLDEEEWDDDGSDVADISVTRESANTRSPRRQDRKRGEAAPAGAVSSGPQQQPARNNNQGILADGGGAPVAGGDQAAVEANEPAPDDGTEAYVHYGVNDMTLTDNDRHSTFSVDVDTASYAVARRKLNEGMLPPTSAVRVEEFVNSLHYGYSGPQGDAGDGAPFAVHMEAAPHPFETSHHIMRVGVKGLELDPEDRKPLHLTFLVDTSGSMSSPDKLGLAQRSLHLLVDNLQEGDTVSLVTYAGSTSVILEPTSVSGSLDQVHSAIDGLSSGGGTAMGTGMELAYQMASNSYQHGHENRVVVLSDGDANIGRTSHEEILRTVQHHAEEGITLSTIGFGMGNYKDVMMEQLANEGDGNYAYIDGFAEAEQVFGMDMAGTMLTIAKDVKIQVEFNPDAVIGYRLIGYENRDIADKDFRNDRVDAGEIGSGHTVTALYDVVLRDDAPSSELATVRIRAKKPGPDSSAREWATLFDGELLRDEWGEASKDLQISFASACFAELLRNSPYVAELSYEDVWKLAKQGSRGTDEDAELLGLIAQAGRLSGERSPLSMR
jgi:Ca-activated chloride channel family protein